MDNKELRLICCGAGVLSAAVLVVLLNVLPLPDSWARLLKCLVDRDLTGSTAQINFLSVQLFMWLFFGWGMGELLTRWFVSRRDTAELELHLLPEDEEDGTGSAVLQVRDMAEVHRVVKSCGTGGPLCRMITMTANQFQSTGSVGICNEVLNSICDLRANEVTASYNIVRYIAWLLPSLGFIGTVVGILNALHGAASGNFSDPAVLSAMISDLSVAFYTTLLSLIMCCVLMFLMHIIQGREEEATNAFAEYCMRNFINRLVA